MNKGFVMLGPVLDPAGFYGLGVIEADDKEQVKEFIANGAAPSINKYEYYPMMAVTTKE
jgi:hypothetical protein